MKSVFPLLSFVLLLAVPASGMFMRPSALPLSRIVKNTEARVEADPADSEARYTLGRAYYLAFFNRSLLVGGYPGRGGSEPQLAPEWMTPSIEFIAREAEAERRALEQSGFDTLEAVPAAERGAYFEAVNEKRQQLQAEDWQPEAIPPAEALAFAERSRGYFERAIEMESDNALYHLGLASLFRQVLSFISEEGVEPGVFADVSDETVAELFWKAFELSADRDAQLERRPVAGLNSLVSHEAGRAWLELGVDDEAKEAVVQSHLERLGDLPIGAITPLVVTAPEIGDPAGFVRGDPAVKFDLDGDGIAEIWDWVSVDTGILVWDPLGDGRVESGSRLFGNATFQILWRDGFHALSALDDDGDSRIAGAELKGLALWYDRNSDAVSDPGEVLPVLDHGVEALLLDGVVQRGGMPLRVDGVVFTEGRRGQLWDWIATRQADR